MQRTLDAASLLTIILTCALFVGALFVKGWTHDLLLEAGVFLVSVKLILAGYKSNATTATTLARLERIEQALGALERRLAAGRSPADGPTRS